MTRETRRDRESGHNEAESPQAGVGEQAPVTAGGEGGAEPFSGTYFGLRRRQYQKQSRTAGETGADPNDYTKRYPKDPIGEEMLPNGRFWRTYIGEAAIFDGTMLNIYQDTIDVLLVFAGLFSAVLTTFVIQTSQNLQPDYTEVSASLLIELVGFQRATSESNTSQIPSSPFFPTISFTPPLAYVWVNTLWFMSLTLSLVTALVSVLVKQWLHQYIATIPDSSARDRSRIRQSRYMGLRKWQIPMIIGLLPVLLHGSLGLFFAGFCIYLFALELVIAYAVAVIAGCVYIAYIGSHILPLVYHNCPYKTPLTIHLYRLYLIAWDRTLRYIRDHPHYDQSFRSHSMRVAEQEGVRQMEDVVDGEAISWLFSTSSNTSVRQVVLQAVLGNHNEKADGIDRAVGDIFDQIGGLSPEMQYSIMQLKRNPFPMSPSPTPLQPFKDTTASLIAILQSPLRQSVVFPQDVWICICDCADWTSPAALVLMGEVMKVWQDKLPPAAWWKTLSQIKEPWNAWYNLRMNSMRRNSHDDLDESEQMGRYLPLLWREEEMDLPPGSRSGRSTQDSDTIIHFLSCMTTELSRTLLGWFCSNFAPLPSTSPSWDRESFNFLTSLEKVLPRMIRDLCDHLSNTDSIEFADSLLDGTFVTAELIRKSQGEESEVEARRHVRSILTSRIFPRDMAQKPRVALLKIFHFQDGMPNFEPSTFLSAKNFYTNGIRCLLSPCSLDNCGTPFRLQYLELEWNLMKMILEPLFSLHSPSLSRSLPDDTSYRSTHNHLSKDNAEMFRIFNDEGGIPALYTRFRATQTNYDSDRLRELGTYLALLITYRMIDLDTFDPLHLPDSESSNQFSFVNCLSLLTRMLLYDNNRRSLTLLLKKLDRLECVSERIWEGYLANLYQWTRDEEFWSEWSSWHRVYAMDYIRRIPDLLPMMVESAVDLPEYVYVEGGSILDTLKKVSKLHDYLFLEDESVFAPLVIHYEQLYPLIDGDLMVRPVDSTYGDEEGDLHEMAHGAEDENSDKGAEYPDRAHGFIEDLPDSSA